tara:strand:- start:547 stop:795 length:249 start_codon:yes stop_codon:yes gene_type:complete
MKGHAYIESKDSRLDRVDEITVDVELFKGDYIRYFPHHTEKEFTNEEVDNGIEIIVLKRVYSTIDGMLYFCEPTIKKNLKIT